MYAPGPNPADCLMCRLVFLVSFWTESVCLLPMVNRCIGLWSQTICVLVLALAFTSLRLSDKSPISILYIKQTYQYLLKEIVRNE